MQPYRRITIAVGVSMFVDASLYLAVLPLLPRYADQFNLNTFQAGLVLAAYPVSVPFVSLGCIVLVPRIGARRISLASALLMTIATVIFAWAPNVEVLILARFVQGFASGSIWTASMSWVTDNAPAGSGLAFGLVAAVSFGGVVLALLAPTGRAVAAGESRLWASIARGARQPATIAAMAMSLIDLCAFGAVDLLVPLGLGRSGTSVDVIAICFAAGAVLGAAVGPIAGRVVDRIGPAPVGLVVGIGVMVIPIVLAFGPSDVVQLALLVTAGPLFAVIGAAMFPLSSLGADTARVSHVTVMGLLGVVWAAGFAVVPLVLGAVASTTSTATAFTLASLLCLPSLVLLVISVRRLGALAAVPAA